jgi:hypothetical protein
MKHKTVSIARTALGTLALACLGTASAQVPTVSQPSGINLGGTSFYDGFSGAPGWAWLSSVRFASANKIKDNDGNDAAPFNSPRISSRVWVNQISYATTASVGGWRPQFTALLPWVSLDSSFGPGPSLRDSGAGLGDITLGAALQSPPVTDAVGNPVFVQRVELDVIAPTGSYDRTADINAGSGFVSFNPYWAATLLPAPRWELSWRLHYLYNAKNNKPAASLALPYAGSAVTSTQAGQAVSLNFTSSYALSPDLSVGINGYYFQQVTDSKANGVAIKNARERVLGIGPGLMWRIADDKSLWVNAYTDTAVRNRASSPLTLQVRTAINF